MEASPAEATPNMFPFLRFNDPDAALAWLARRSDSRSTLFTRGDDGSVQHAEIELGPGIVMFGPGDPASQGVYVAVEDADAHYEHAKAAGAEIVREIEGHRLWLARIHRA